MKGRHKNKVITFCKEEGSGGVGWRGGEVQGERGKGGQGNRLFFFFFFLGAKNNWLMSQMRHFLNETSYNYKWGLILTLTHSLRTGGSFSKQYQKHNLYSNLSFYWASICIPLKRGVTLTDKEEKGRLKESRPKMYMWEKIWKLFLGFITFQKIFRRRARAGDIQATYETTN